MRPTRKNRRNNINKKKKTLKGGAGFGNTRPPRNGELLGRIVDNRGVLHGNDLARIINRETLPQIEALINSLSARIDELEHPEEESPVGTPVATPVGEDPL